MTPCAITVLVAELDGRFTEIDAGLASDIALRHGADYASVAAWYTGWLVEAGYHSDSDAMSAVIEIAAELGDDIEGPDSRRWGLRLVVCNGSDAGPAGGPSASDRGIALIARAGRGQILTTAATAVVAGPTLPRGAELLDRGLWLADPARRQERTYELCVAGTTITGISTSNLGWARRHADIAAGFGPQLGTLTDNWRHRRRGGLRIILITGRSPVERTAVAAQLALRLHNEQVQVLYGRWEAANAHPLHAFRDALGAHADSCDDPRLLADLDGRLTAIRQLLPEIGARFGIRSDPHDASGLLAADSDKAALIDAIESWILRIASRSPTLFVLDAVDHADEDSLTLLARMWHACWRQSLMTVLIADDDNSAAAAVVERVVELAVQVKGSAFERVRL